MVEWEKNNREERAHFHSELETARTMQGDLIEALKPTLLLLFSCLDWEGDLWAQAGRLLPERPATVQRQSCLAGDVVPLSAG